MQTKRILIKLIPLLIILSILWFLLYISKEIIKQPEDHISSYIPESTEWIVDLNTHDIIEKGVQSVLFSKKPDLKLNTLISSFILQQKDNGIRFDEIGIRLNSNIYLFEIFHQNESYICGLFNLENKSLFIENTPELFSDQFQAFNAENIGLIIYSRGNKKPEVAQTIFNNSNNNQSPSHYSFNLKTNSTGFSSDLQVSVLDSSIILNGTFSADKNLIAPNLTLKPEGFHFTSRIIPQLISDSLCKILNIDSNRILGISINHFSSELMSQPEISLLLNSSILLHFKSPISMRDQLDKMENLDYLIDTDNNSFVVMNQEYYYYQINSSSIFIGKTPFKEDLIMKSDDVLCIEGSPSNLTNIKGKGFVYHLLKVIPLFQASESLTNSIESIQVITIPENENGRNKIEGEITFKPGTKTMNELIRFVLLMNE